MLQLATRVLAYVIFATCAVSSADSAIISSFDFIDDFVRTGGYSGPGDYDVINGQTGLFFGNAGFVADGRSDFTVSVSTFGGGVSGGVSYTAANAVSGVGLQSVLAASGSVGVNNPGHKWSQQIDVLFNPNSLTVEAQDVSDFSISSGNTAAILWETAFVQYLDINGNPFSAIPLIGPYLSHTSINGQNGIGTAQADSTGTVDNVGMDSVVSGTSGSRDSSAAFNAAFNTPAKLGITSGTTLIGGVRFTHLLEDVRGINNSGSTLTATMNDLQLSNFEVAAVPEPSSFAYLGCVVLIAFRTKRNRVGDSSGLD
ncbi:MAG: hypothetical protein WBH28_26630 [Fuerstiella sp.]|mgnify:CR=1 FL=1